MLNRLPIVLASALAAGAVTVGVAVAQHDGYGHSTPTQDPGAQTQKPAAKWNQFKKLSASRLSQSAYLTGLAEVDDEGDDAGDPDGKGSATFLLADQKTICYGFTARGIGTPKLVHIHAGEAGKNGPPVIEFANLPKGADGQPNGNPGASSGCKVPDKPGEIAALTRIRRNMKRVADGKARSNYYLNIHTDEFPAGAIRGQLTPAWYDNEG